MRKIVRFLFLRPVLWSVQRFSSRPKKDRIFKALDKLYESIHEEPAKKVLDIPFQSHAGKFIILSDQHKGGRDGADDFAIAEPNYLAALDYYCRGDYYFICLGDSEELWENSLGKVKKFNERPFAAERKFVEKNAFAKVIGNHDLYWGNDPFAWWQLKSIFKQDVKIYEAVVLSTSVGEQPLRIFCTHGHQGDAQSDGNWFSKFFVARIWAPLQAYLRINPNTAAYNTEKKTLHNEIMYDWSSAQKDTLLITGHTHQPVFASLTLIERLYKEMQTALAGNDAGKIAQIEKEIKKIERNFTSIAIDYLVMKPTYFNSGCCCFADGDMTGIEIAEGKIKLIKWTTQDESPCRVVLEEAALVDIMNSINPKTDIAPA